ncbi:MAG: hypothetical protein ACI9JN_001529 [Bacteroidia bacterium]|jgi:hypothetical protein
MVFLRRFTLLLGLLSANLMVFAQDADKDGVNDAIDKQQDTPEGCEVDSFGVALDGDMDGVPNCKDKELDTREGAIVDAHGVEKEADFFFRSGKYYVVAAVLVILFLFLFVYLKRMDKRVKKLERRA